MKKISLSHPSSKLGKHSLSLFVAFLISLSLSVFILGKTSHWLTLLTATAEDDAPTQYEVESKDQALTEATEESIEQDIDQFTPDFSEETIEEEPLTASNSFPAKKLLPLSGLLNLAPPVKHTDAILRIGFVTDTHVGSSGRKDMAHLEKKFIDRINYLTQKMNDEVGPDFIVVNGDVIEGTRIPAVQGMEELHQTKQLFDQTSIPKYWVLGNHDVRSVSKHQWKQALDIHYTHKAFRVKGYKIIILDSNFNGVGEDVGPGPGRSYTRGNIASWEKRWLKRELSSPERKIVFLHHPPLRELTTQSNENLLRDALELQDLFKNGNVIGVFTGHIEDLYSERHDNTQYFVFPGMTKSPHYLGNFVTIQINDGQINNEMSYLGKEGEYVTIDMFPESLDVKEEQ